MTIEIPDPPTIRACSGCMRALHWLYSARTGQWVAFAAEPTDNRLLRVDECPRYGVDRPATWRDEQARPVAPMDAPGRLAAREVAAAAAGPAAAAIRGDVQ